MARIEFSSIANPASITGICGWCIEGEGELEWKRKGRRSMPVSGQDKQEHVLGGTPRLWFRVTGTSQNVPVKSGACDRGRDGFGSHIMGLENDSEGIMSH